MSAIVRSDELVIVNGQPPVLISLGDSFGLRGPRGATPIAMGIRGTLVAALGVIPFPWPYDASIARVQAAVGTAPTGASIVFDVLKNGVSIFPTAPKPTILAGQVLSVPTVPDDVVLAAGDLLTVDIEQVGSIQPGANATIVLTVI